MSYAVTLSESRRFLVITVEGSITVELARSFAREASRVSGDSGINRFLFDVREASNVDSVIANYRFAYEDMPALGLSRSARSAILTREDDRSHEFVELAAQNAGYLVRLFSERGAAVAWLEEP